MTFTDALSSISNTGTSRNAAKRGEMGGYLWAFRTAKNGLAELTQDGDYRLAFVQRDGDQFIYTFTASTGTFAYNGKVAAGSAGALDDDTAPTASNTLVLDPELLRHVGVGEDWSTGTQADFEASRTGTGEW